MPLPVQIYKLRPQTVRAEQYLGDPAALADDARFSVGSDRVYYVGGGGTMPTVLRPLDWIVTREDGTVKIMRPVGFHAMYEPAPAEENQLA